MFQGNLQRPLVPLLTPSITCFPRRSAIGFFLGKNFDTKVNTSTASESHLGEYPGTRGPCSGLLLDGVTLSSTPEFFGSVVVILILLQTCAHVQCQLSQVDHT